MNITGTAIPRKAQTYAGGYKKEEKWKKVNSENTLNYNQS